MGRFVLSKDGRCASGIEHYVVESNIYCSAYAAFLIAVNAHNSLRRMVYLPCLMKAGKEGRMTIIAWLVLGLISGFIGRVISTLIGGTIVDEPNEANKPNRQFLGRGIIGELLVGIAGSLVGGFLFSFFGASGVTGLNLYSLLVAVTGSTVLLLAFYGFRRNRYRNVITK